MRETHYPRDVPCLRLTECGDGKFYINPRPWSNRLLRFQKRSILGVKNNRLG